MSSEFENMKYKIWDQEKDQVTNHITAHVYKRGVPMFGEFGMWNTVENQVSVHVSNQIWVQLFNE